MTGICTISAAPGQLVPAAALTVWSFPPWTAASLPGERRSRIIEQIWVPMRHVRARLEPVGPA